MGPARTRKAARRKAIYLVGEGTGETVRTIARAALAQFSSRDIEIKSFYMIEEEQQIQQIIKDAAKDNALVAFTIVQPHLRDCLIREAERGRVKAIDVIGDFIIHLSMFLGEKPLGIPGRQHLLDEDYFRRIEAINFAVKHDDGKEPEGLRDADIVIVGLSRTGKTPLSTYLAHQGWKVANVPLHPQMEAPKELFEINQGRIFGLIISVESLVKLREARLKQVGLPLNAKYADPVKVAEEIDWCIQYYRAHPRWHIIDVSNRAIEEIAAAILKELKR
ncbi:MAG TPA: kinase/pyrophosphorylase [Nitrospirae bacterium]|nr:kinase/pyrophosphorylase [Nitrospirota bacterium]